MSIPIAMYFKIGPKGWSDAAIFVTLPFLHQMMITAVLSFLIIVILSHLQTGGKDDPKGIDLSMGLFKTGPAFNIGATIIILVCITLYAVFW